MRTLHLLLGLALVASAAGCTRPEESTDEERTRGMTALMPDGATRLLVDITSTAPGNAHLTVAVDANGTVLGEEEFDATGQSSDHTLEVDTGGAQLVGVQITSRGDAVLHVVLVAILPSGEREELRDEWMTIAAA